MFIVYFLAYNDYDEDNTAAEEEEDDNELSIIKRMQEMMNSAGWKKRPSSGMFMKLFRYTIQI